MHQLSVCDPEVFRIVLIVNSWGALLEGGGGGGGGGPVMGNIKTAIVVGVQKFYHKRTARTAHEYAEERRNYKDLISKNNK